MGVTLPSAPGGPSAPPFRYLDTVWGLCLRPCNWRRCGRWRHRCNIFAYGSLGVLFAVLPGLEACRVASEPPFQTDRDPFAVQLPWRQSQRLRCVWGRERRPRPSEHRAKRVGEVPPAGGNCYEGPPPTSRSRIRKLRGSTARESPTYLGGFPTRGQS